MNHEQPLDGSEEYSEFEDPDFRPWNMELNSYCMLMHFSQFAGFVVPFAGFIMPVVMWSTNKDKSPVIDEHGKNILNWLISSIIYGVISAILIFLLVGILMLIALGLLSLIFTIVGAVKANEGVIYKYPMAITFFK